jgi:dTDP-4-dehydrorhamnose reductase
MTGIKLLVTGAEGMLGRDVVGAARAAGHEVAAYGRGALDITDPASLEARVAEARPEVIVNCAGFADVDAAEAREDEAQAVNGEGAGNVARAAAAAGAAIVHVSTDYVFDGDAGRPYVESDTPAPASAYGRTKLAGERAVAEATPQHVIVRTAWLFGVHGRNFVDTMLHVARDRGEATVVDDQTGSPTYTGHLAAALVALAGSGAWGLHHVAGSGSCTWYDLAAATFERAGVACRLERGRSADLDRAAPRPAWSVLETERRDSVVLPPWERGLDAYLAARAARVGVPA